MIACNGSAEPYTFVGRVVGLVYSGTIVKAPDTVAVGSPFSASFITFGGGCIIASVGEEIADSGNLVVVTPYDSVNPRVSACEYSDRRLLPHAPQLQFNQRGPATVRVRGASNALEHGAAPVWLTIERLVYVQ